MKRDGMKLKELAKKHKKASEMCFFLRYCDGKGNVKDEALLSCGKNHERFFNKTMGKAVRTMKLAKNCSVCGKPLGKNEWSMMYMGIENITADFKAFRFCSEKCWDEW